MSKCYIQIAGGIGNVIQSIPFIKQCKTQFDEVYGVYTRQDFTPKLFDAILPCLKGLFTNDHIFDTYCPPDAPFFGTPIEHPTRAKFEKWDEPEYKKWFTVHEIPYPKTYDVRLKYDSSIERSHKFIIWGGCKAIWKSKRWPYWADLASKLEDVAIVGLPDEGGDMPDHVVDYRGKISLPQVAGLISKCEYYIGNEGGVSHLANAVGAKTFIIYGASCDKKNMPPQRKGLYKIALNLPCQPCQFLPNRGFTAGEGCPELSCLKTLSPDIVLSHIHRSNEDFLNNG